MPMTSNSCQHHPNLNHKNMEMHHCSCNFCKAPKATDDSSNAISIIAHEDLTDEKNPCTATNNQNATTFQSPINHPTHECISSTFTSNTYISGESRTRYWHHRWRRRSVTASSWRRWGILMEEEFPFVSLCLPTGFRQNPSSQEGLVKLSSLTMMTLAALVVVSTSITNWFYDYFGACMITMMRLSLILLILVFLNQIILVNLIVDYICLLVFDTIELVIRCANNTRKIYYNQFLTFVMNPTIEHVINKYSNVKKTVVVGSVSRKKAMTEKNKLNPSDKIFPSTSSVVLLLYTTLIAISQSTVLGMPSRPEDSAHVTAIYGDWVALNCDVNFPDGHVVPYVVQWWRKERDLPIYIWYDDYPSHIAKEYIDRVDRVDSSDQRYGLASLNLTKVTEKDRGWYNCKVLFLDRGPDAAVNGTWYHLDVHAKPHFVQKPEDIEYVGIRDQVILICQAAGTPTPEVLWFKNEAPVQIQPGHIGIFNDGTELRISGLQNNDIGDYTCIARNGEGRIHHTTKLVKAGQAFIKKPPYNKTVEEQTTVTFPCQGEAKPANITTNWFKWLPIKTPRKRNYYAPRNPDFDVKPLRSINSLAGRFQIKSDGSLEISDVTASDEGKFECRITNGIGKPISASAYLAVEYKARVSFVPTHQYIPRGLQGMIRCHVLANPRVQFVTWTKNKRIYDPFEEEGVMALPNGTILIDKVMPKHAGEYTCQPYNLRGSQGKSKPMIVEIRDPPTIVRRPEAEYQRNVGGKVTMPCQAAGPPKVTISWRRVDGRSLPRKRNKIFNGELTLENLRKDDHGVYECVVKNDVATIIARSALLIERTTPHAPRNITVSNSGTFAVTIQWLPGYSGCAACRQEYKIRYREKDSKFTNWIELPVNPPDARKIQIHDLNANTRYEFQVIGTNEYGDGMFSEIIEASTKGDGSIDYDVIPGIAGYLPTASPSEQSTRIDCIEFNININAPSGQSSDESGSSQGQRLAYFNIDHLQRDSSGKIIFPAIPKEKNGPGPKPGAATNLTLTQEAGGWVLRWIGPKDESADAPITYYTIEYKQDSQGDDWRKLTDAQIDPEEASYMMKNIGTSKNMLFKVFSHSVNGWSESEPLEYNLPENVKTRAVTAGLIGGILFFIVAIILSVCTVKICNKARRRKQERAYNMVAQQATDGTMIDGANSQVPLKRYGKSRVPVVSFGGVDVEGYSTYYNDEVDGGGYTSFKSQKYKRRKTGRKSVRRGLISMFDTASIYVQSLHDRVGDLFIKDSSASEGFYDSNLQYGYDSDELDYSGGRRRTKKVGKSSSKSSRYSVQLEYPTQPGYGNNRGPKSGFISRTQEGKFVIEPEEAPFNQQQRSTRGGDDGDEGGFEVQLPPNRFRTRSVAIVAGYSPERLYSNMPAGAFVVESGMYKVNSGRSRAGAVGETGEQWERPEPVYWKQVVFGSRNIRGGSDGSGTLPKYRRLPKEPESDANDQQRLVGQIVDEDLRRLRALDPNNNNSHHQGSSARQLPRQTSHALGWPVTNLSGILPNYQNQQPSYSNLTALSGMNNNSTSLIGTENLEIIRQRPSHTSGRTRKSPKLRASSPIDQNQPLSIAPGGYVGATGPSWPPMSPELSPFNSQIGMVSGGHLGHFDSELSSVPHLSSNERSIPSTLLTSPPTGLGSSMEGTQSTSSRNLSRKTTSTGTMGSSSTGAGVTTMTSELGTIPEDENYMSFGNQPMHQSLNTMSPGNQVQADGNDKRRPPFAALTNRAKDIERQIYWSRETYRNADSLFPNYALNYPTPVHGSISPSKQYPPRFGYEQEMFGGVYPNQYVQHPYQYYINPELQYQQSQPASLSNVFTTSQFAQPQSPEMSTANDGMKQSNMTTTPLATSSPPISRRSQSYSYHNMGFHPDNGQQAKVQKHSAPAQLSSYLASSQRQISVGSAPIMYSPSQQLHDYENMRYSSHPINSQSQASHVSSVQSESTPPVPISRQKITDPPQPPLRPKRIRDATQDDGIESHSEPGKEHFSTRTRKTGAPTKKSYTGVPIHSSRISSSNIQPQVGASQSDAVSLVSEVLDAEVTALTNSSSPGSSIGSGKHPRTPLRYYQGQSKKSKSSIPGSAKEQQYLDQSLNNDGNVEKANVSDLLATEQSTSGSSGLGSKNTSASQNQSSASIGTSSTGDGSKPSGENILGNVQSRKKKPVPKERTSPPSRKELSPQDAPSYENWPPLAPRKTVSMPLSSMYPPASVPHHLLSKHSSQVEYSYSKDDQNPLQMPPSFDPHLQITPQQSNVSYMSSIDHYPGVHSPPSSIAPSSLLRQGYPNQYQHSSIIPTSNVNNVLPSDSYSQKQQPHYYFRASPGGGTEFVDVDSSLDGTTMPSLQNNPQQTMTSATQGGGGSRPGSSHSAPMLDLSIDRHYEFDAARTPTDDLGHISDSPAAQLPRNWNRPYLGYNPRVDRELGSAAELARSERVFSDSEIYSPVFPRGRPSPTKGNTDSGSAAAEAVSARVEAMRKEFAEYQREQILSNTKNSDNKSSPTSKSSTNPTSIEAASASSVQTNIDEIEIPLRVPKLQRPPSSSPPPPPLNTSPYSGLESSDKKLISGQVFSKENVPKSTSGTAGQETGTSAKCATEDDRLESLI